MTAMLLVLCALLAYKFTHENPSLLFVVQDVGLRVH